MNQVSKETLKFIMESIEKLSEAILLGEHDNSEMQEINQQAELLLNELENN